MTPWERVFAWIRKIEGGFSDSPADPGGATFEGVTARAAVGVDMDQDGRWDFDFDHDGDVDRDDILELRKRVEMGDVQAQALVEEFYKTRYWDRIRGNDLSWPTRLIILDCAINSGAGAAVVLLQRAASVQPDGIVGPATLAAVQRLQGTAWTEKLLRARVQLYLQIVARRPQSSEFLEGWMMRIVLLGREAQ